MEWMVFADTIIQCVPQRNILSPTSQKNIKFHHITPPPFPFPPSTYNNPHGNTDNFDDNMMDDSPPSQWSLIIRKINKQILWSHCPVRWIWLKVIINYRYLLKGEARKVREKSACPPSCESPLKNPRHLVQLLAIRIIIPLSAHSSVFSLILTKSRNLWELTREKVRGAGRKYQHDWLYLQSINSSKDDVLGLVSL
jgi:hypothetical protein